MHPESADDLFLPRFLWRFNDECQYCFLCRQEFSKLTRYSPTTTELAEMSFPCLLSKPDLCICFIHTYCVSSLSLSLTHSHTHTHTHTYTHTLSLSLSCSSLPLRTKHYCKLCGFIFCAKCLCGKYLDVRVCVQCEERADYFLSKPADIQRQHRELKLTPLAQNNYEVIRMWTPHVSQSACHSSLSVVCVCVRHVVSPVSQTLDPSGAVVCQAVWQSMPHACLSQTSHECPQGRLLMTIWVARR